MAYHQYQNMDSMDPPCYRNGTLLIVPGSPDDITEGDIYQEFSQFGLIRRVERDPINGNIFIQFNNLWEAVKAERYTNQSFGPPNQPAAPMGITMGDTMCSPMVGSIGAQVGTNHLSSQFSLANARSPPLKSFPAPPPAILGISAPDNGAKRHFSANDSVRSFDGFGDNQADPTLAQGPCLKCSKNTSYTCGRCGSFYCSPGCQKQDWPKHQTNCNNSIPPLNYAGRSNITETESPPSADMEQSSWRQRDFSGPPPGASFSQGGGGGGYQGGRFQRNSPRSNGYQYPRSEPSKTSNLSDRPPHSSGGDGDQDKISRQSADRQGSGSKFNHSRQGNFNDGRRGRPSGERPGFGSRQGYGQRRRNNSRDRQDSSESSKTDNPITILRGDTSSENGAIFNREKMLLSENPKETTDVESKLSFLKLSPLKPDKGPEPSPPKPVQETPVEPSTPATVPSSPASTSASETISGTVVLSASPVSPATHSTMAVVIPSGEKVILSFAENGQIYLRPADLAKFSDFATLNDDLASHCASAPSLDRQPKKKEFLAVQFSLDKAYYRAVVESKPVKTEHKYVVRFVDFGNSEAGVTSDKMKLLPDNLVNIPFMAVKTFFKGIDSQSFTGEASAILNKYFIQEIPLTVVYDGQMQDGVTLIDSDGSSLNEKILAVLLPSNPTPDATAKSAPQTPAAAPISSSSPATVAALTPVATPTPVAAPTPAAVPAQVAAPLANASGTSARKFTYEDISSFPLPPIGQPTEVLINFVHDVAGCLMVCVPDAETLQAISEMTDKLQTYAEAAQPFRPSDGELCVAKWSDEMWYRGVCVEAQGNACNVMFLEYGNTDSVKYSDIRAFTEELLKTPVLSTMCFLNGLDLTESQKKKLKNMFKDQWIETITVITKEEGSATIDCPAITGKL